VLLERFIKREQARRAYRTCSLLEVIYTVDEIRYSFVYIIIINLFCFNRMGSYWKPALVFLPNFPKPGFCKSLNHLYIAIF
jgi:hypothetical protein